MSLFLKYLLLALTVSLFNKSKIDTLSNFQLEMCIYSSYNKHWSHNKLWWKCPNVYGTKQNNLDVSLHYISHKSFLLQMYRYLVRTFIFVCYSLCPTKRSNLSNLNSLETIVIRRSRRSRSARSFRRFSISF